MKKKDLQRAFNRRIVITFKAEGEILSFLKEIKSLGGKWFNGKKINVNEKWSNEFGLITDKLCVDKDFCISKISAMCYHFGAYPTIPYHKFATDKGTVDVRN